MKTAGRADVSGTDRLHYESMELRDAQLLAYDETGEGRIVEVFGDVATAEHIIIFVPGNDNGLGNYFDRTTRERMDTGKDAPNARAERPRRGDRVGRLSDAVGISRVVLPDTCRTWCDRSGAVDSYPAAIGACDARRTQLRGRGVRTRSPVGASGRLRGAG